MTSVMWDRPELAGLYDRISDLQFEGGRRLVGMMGVRSGDAVLDVGCGTGRLAVYVAGLVGPAGSVTGIDPSPHRIRVAEDKLKGLSCPNVRFELGKGEDLSAFSARAFDHVCYSSAIHWVADKQAALEEAYRVLKPGGNVGMNTVDRDQHSAMKKMMDELIARKFPEHVWVMGEMSKLLVNDKEIGGLLEAAGFTDVRTETVAKKHVYPSPQALFQFIEASSFGNFLREVPGDVKARMLDDLGRELETLRTPAGIELTSKMLYAVAAK